MRKDASSTPSNANLEEINKEFELEEIAFWVNGD